MRKPGVLMVLAVVACAALVVGPAVAGGDANRPNNDPKDQKVTDEALAAGDLALAQQLADYGRRTKDPLALLAAAKIMKATPKQEMESRPVTYRPDDVEAKDKAESSAKRVTAEGLLSEAKALSGEDEALAAIAASVASEASRGRKGGPVCGTYKLDARSYQLFTETFVAGELARVVLRGDGDTDLDLLIYDENGNLIDKDTDGTDLCICEWVPRWTGPFVIRIENLGYVWNQYDICTN